MAHYVSEATLFLAQLKAERPHLEAEQQKGRALLWKESPLNLDDRARQEAARVKQKPYVYQSN
jgi:hypothetical protein